MSPGARRALTGALWAAAALSLAWALMRTLGLERGFPLQPLVAWTPFVIPPALAVAVAAAVARRWAPATLATLACGLLVAAVLPRAIGDGWEAPGADGPELVVVSANLKLGEADADAVVELVRETDADVLCAQELTEQMADRLDQAGLEELLPNWLDEAGESSTGSGIYTRLEVEVVGDAGPPGYWFPMPMARVFVPGAAAVDVESIHTLPTIRASQTEDWKEGLDALPATGDDTPLTVLAGDFNATLDHEELRQVVASGYVDAGDATGKGLEPTWPQGSLRPPVTIDHVLADERISILDYEVHELEGSDHRAVSATLRLPAGRQGPARTGSAR